MKIQTFDSGEKVLESDLNSIDVLFLDVDMPVIDGLERIIRERNKDMIIIFLTAYSEFVFESFKVNAFRYLIKPLKNKELAETLEAVQKKLCEPEEYLNFQFQNEIYSIKYSDILYSFSVGVIYNNTVEKENIDELIDRCGKMRLLDEKHAEAQFIEGKMKLL